MRADEVGAGSALIEEDEAFHGDARDRFRPEAALLLDRGLVLLDRPQGLLFSRQPQTPERPPHRPGMHPHPGLVRKPVPVLGQGQVVGVFDQVLERGLDLIPYHGPGPAPHRPGLQPALDLLHRAH